MNTESKSLTQMCLCFVHRPHRPNVKSRTLKTNEPTIHFEVPILSIPFVGTECTLTHSALVDSLGTGKNRQIKALNAMRQCQMSNVNVAEGNGRFVGTLKLLDACNS